MKRKYNWLLKIINPQTNYILTIYEDGLVYVKNYNEKLFKLSKDSINKINKYINKDLYYLKRQDRIIQNTKGFIIQINDISRKHRTINIFGWKHEGSIIELIKNKSNIVKSFV